MAEQPPPPASSPPLAPAPAASASRADRRAEKRRAKEERKRRCLRRLTVVAPRRGGAPGGGVVVRTCVPCPDPPPASSHLPDAMVETAVEAVDGVHVVTHSVRCADLRHVDHFWRCAALAPLRALGTELFGDVKEITESVAALRAADAQLRRAGVAWPAAAVVAVADGGTPRTAAVFIAATAAARVHSVDPELRPAWLAADAAPWAGGRLACHRARVEDFAAGAARGGGAWGGAECAALVIVAVHSHVRLDAYVPQLRALLPAARTVIVAMPCCVDQALWDPAAGRAAAAGGVGCPVRAALSSAPASAAAAPPAAAAQRSAAQRRRDQIRSDMRLCDAGRVRVLPVREYYDWGVHSPDRIVRVWDLPPLQAAGDAAGARGAARTEHEPDYAV